MNIQQIDESAGYISTFCNGQVPRIAIILGSGLGPLANHIDDSVTIPYSHIPNFQQPTATGHKGNLIIVDGDTCKFEANPEDFSSITDKIDANLYGLFPQV